MPTLNYLFLHKKGLTTSQLISLLESELEVTGKDAELIKGRKDTHFSQKVRNLVSHKTLESKGLATFDRSQRDGVHEITELGEKYLLENINDFSFLITNNFSEKQRDEVIKKDYSNLVIEEGFVTFGQVKKRKRSRKLIQIAKDHYTINGKIYCSACNFNFEDFYGQKGKGYIEIHHIIPIYTQDNVEKSLEEALENVTPVCSNCHRMIHRNNDELLSIPSLKELITINGVFNHV